jgi:hypothetical protein
MPTFPKSIETSVRAIAGTETAADERSNEVASTADERSFIEIDLSHALRHFKATHESVRLFPGGGDWRRPPPRAKSTDPIQVSSLGSYVVRFAPCVDGSPLARAFLMFCSSVGAAMCSACLCGTQRPLAIMPSAKMGPDQKHALEAPWRKWVFPFSVSTDGALHRDCPSQTLPGAVG